MSCPVCSEAFADARPAVRCRACDARLHEACWKYNKGCATFGCASKGFVADDAEPGEVVPALTTGPVARTGVIVPGCLTSLGLCCLPYLFVDPLVSLVLVLGVGLYQLGRLRRVHRLDPSTGELLRTWQLGERDVWDGARWRPGELKELKVRILPGTSRYVVEARAGQRRAQRLAEGRVRQWAQDAPAVEAVARAFDCELVLPDELRGHHQLPQGAARALGVGEHTRDVTTGPAPDVPAKLGKKGLPVLRPPRCGGCGEEVTRDTALVCAGCATFHHAPCWQAAKGCTHEGCRGRISVPAPPAVREDEVAAMFEFSLLARNDPGGVPLWLRGASCSTLLSVPLLAMVGAALHPILGMVGFLAGLVLMALPGGHTYFHYEIAPDGQAISRQTKLLGRVIADEPEWLRFDQIEELEVTSLWGDDEPPSPALDRFLAAIRGRQGQKIVLFNAPWSRWHKVHGRLQAAAQVLDCSLHLPKQLAARRERGDL